MNNLQGDNNNPLINKCKIYGNKYLKEILYQYKIINNIKIKKSELNKFNKSQIYNFIDKYNIDIEKNKFNIDQDLKCFMGDMYYYSYGNNIHKKYKYRKLVNYFIFNMDLCLYHRRLM